MRAKHISSDAELTKQLGDLVTYNTGPLALLGHVNVELLTRRRELIKPQLNKEYSSLFSSQTSITGFLFGHDLQTQLASIKASNKIGQATTSGAISITQPHGANSTNQKFQCQKAKHFPMAVSLFYGKAGEELIAPIKLNQSFQPKRRISSDCYDNVSWHFCGKSFSVDL